MTTRNGETSTVNPQQRGKLGVSYGWVSPIARKRSARSSCLRTLIKYLKLYCKHSSLVGLKCFAEDRATWFDRILWTIAYTCTMFLVGLFSLLSYLEFIDTPITTTPEADLYPTEHLEFPGVAICSINRMSLRKATELATEIYNANISNLSLDETLGTLWMLGDFYESSYTKPDNDYTVITQLLSKLHDNDYDIANIMKRLTPECSDMLVFCYFLNEKQNCSDIFTVGQTEDGFCCTFNYIPERDDALEAVPSLARPIQSVGETNGLRLVMDPILDDYFYPILPTTGWKVTIFDPYDFPEMSSGGVVQFLLSPLVEKYVELDAVGLRSSDEIRSYPIGKRGCYFPDERPSIYATYTVSDCILACKMDDIWESCKCRPFFYPRSRLTERSDKTCTAEDIPCLTKYPHKRRYIVPYPEETLHSLTNNSRTLDCRDCYPSCEDNTYIAKSSVSHLEPGYFETTLLHHVNVTNHSILHMYFGKVGTVYLKQDESYRWYEYLSDIGGICGFFVGFSLISVMEVVYFSMLFLSELLEPERDPGTTREDESPRKQPSIRDVYWNELFPRSRIGVEERKRNDNLF